MVIVGGLIAESDSNFSRYVIVQAVFFLESYNIVHHTIGFHEIRSTKKLDLLEFLENKNK